jgi:hypothetical protein
VPAELSQEELPDTGVVFIKQLHTRRKAIAGESLNLSAIGGDSQTSTRGEQTEQQGRANLLPSLLSLEDEMPDNSYTSLQK